MILSIMYRVDVSSFDSIMTCIVFKIISVNRLSIMVDRMCVYTIVIINCMSSANISRTIDVVIIIGNRLINIGDSIVKSTRIDAICVRMSRNYTLLPMMHVVNIMIVKISSIRLQVLIIVVKSMMRTLSFVTTNRT